MDAEIIDDFAAVRLLINTYTIKRVKNSFRPVNQEKFIEDVCKLLSEKNFMYPRKSILFTWKHLLDSYQHYKQNYTTEQSTGMWKYFTLMDNCFGRSIRTSQKFNDERILSLIKFLGKHRAVVLRFGLTMDVLQDVEDSFQKLGIRNINQRDIYSEWLFLKRLYKKLSVNTQLSTNVSYYNALREFCEKKPSDCVSQVELDSAIDSIRASDRPDVKRRKISNRTEINNEPNPTKYTPFTTEMHNILLRCLKKHKELQNLNSELDDTILNGVVEEFRKLGHNVTKTSVCNEWNDLTCRYELIKNSEHPELWPYFNDMNSIYANENLGRVYTADDVAEDAETENVGQLLKKRHKVSRNNLKISEKLLNIYECNNKEFLEIKDTLIERNLLRDETNYLLNMFVEKFSKKKT